MTKNCTDADIIKIYGKTHTWSCPLILALRRRGLRIEESLKDGEQKVWSRFI